MNQKSNNGSSVNPSNYVEKHLTTPPEGEGYRHADMRSLSLQMVGEGYPDSDTYGALKQRYPEKSDKEIWDLIKGAYRLNPKPALIGAGRRQFYSPNYWQVQQPTVKPFKLQETTVTPELPKSVATIEEFLLTAFNPDEIVSLTNEAGERNGRLGPVTNGSFYVVSDLIALIKKDGTEMLDSDAGCWIRVNPIKPGDESGKDSSVADWRHVLVEFDNIPKAQQYQIFTQSGLPITALIDSGGKSIHAWVKVDASSAEEHEARAKIIYDYFAAYKPDPNNKNESRYSRLPGVKRAGVMQQLVALNVGANTWGDWFERMTDREMVGGSVLDYANAPINNEATLLGDRYLCRGAGMFIVAPSGQGKSSLAVQLMTEWSIGGNPLGIAASDDLRVMLIQAEDDMGDITEMSKWILNVGFSAEKLRKMIDNTHIEPVNDVVGPNFVATLDNLCKQWKPDVVIINPYTSYLGDDAKDEKAANRFLREGLTPLLVRHNCAAIIMHHTPKTQFNPSADFTTTDFMYRGSGCATMTNWARAYLVFEPLPNDDKVFRFVAAKRGDRTGWDSKIRFYRHSRTPGVIKWEQATIEEIDNAMKKPSAKRTKEVVSDEVLLSVLSASEPFIKDQAIQSMRALDGVTRDDARSAFERFLADGRIMATQLPPELEKRRGPKQYKYLKTQVLREKELNTAPSQNLFGAN
jgi:RecA-family ATPase